MDVARPYSAVVPSIDGDVLVALAGTTRPMTGRQVAERANRGSQKAVSVALDRLVEHGLVLRQQVGRAYLHSLNRDHLAAGAVEQLAGLRQELMDRLMARFGEWLIPPYHASIFGSAARGDGNTESDIDLLIVRPPDVDEENEGWRWQLDDLSDAVLSWTGNHVGIVEIAARDLPSLVDADAPVLEEFRRESFVLANPPFHFAVANARQLD